MILSEAVGRRWEGGLRYEYVEWDIISIHLKSCVFDNVAKDVIVIQGGSNSMKYSSALLIS